MCTNMHILKMELRRRNKDDTTYANRYMKIWSIAVIICGTIFGCSYSVGYFQGFCNVSAQILTISISGQVTFLGCYQLSRLHYCFAQAKVHNRYGYSRCLFIILYIIGFSAFITAVIFPWLFTPFYIKCGINDNLQYYPFKQTFKSNPMQGTAIWINITIFLYILWDVTILLLYTCKVLQFNRKVAVEDNIKKRIMFILNRILILTLFYEIVFVFLGIVSVVQDNVDWEGMYVLVGFSYQFVSIVVSYSIFLMQSHNTDKYRKFLTILYTSKLYYIGCCCCGRMIRNDLYSSSSVHAPSQEQTPKKPESTIFDTRDVSIVEVNIEAGPIPNSPKST